MSKSRDLANIISGGFTADDIPNLDTAKVTTGTFDDARISATSVNQHVDLTNLNADNLTSGTVSIDRLGSSGTKDATTFLRGDNTFAEAGGGVNTPAFRAYANTDFTTAANGSYYLMSCNVEDFDTDSCYDTSTYTFTPTTAGKYYVYGNAYIFRSDNTQALNYANVRIYKNGSAITDVSFDSFSDPEIGMGMFTATVVEMNGTTDNLKLYARGYAAGQNVTIAGNSISTYFGAYKIIE